MAALVCSAHIPIKDEAHHEHHEACPLYHGPFSDLLEVAVNAVQRSVVKPYMPDFRGALNSVS